MKTETLTMKKGRNKMDINREEDVIRCVQYQELSMQYGYTTDPLLGPFQPLLARKGAARMLNHVMLA